MPTSQVINTSYQAAIDQRRTIVARSRLKGMTLREIVDGLKQAGMLNPRSGAPWSLGTICYDVKAIRKSWRQRAAEDWEMHVARILAEIQELRREGWRLNNYTLVLKCIDRECKLLGLDQPDKLVVDWREEAERAGFDNASDVFNELVVSAAEALGGTDGTGGDS